MVYTVLAFDVSSRSTGYAVFLDGVLQKDFVGLIKLDNETHGERLTIFEEEVLKLLNLHNPDQVVVEEIWKGPSPKTFKILAYYHGVMRKALFEWKSAEPQMFMPSEARRIVGDRFETSLVPSRKKRVKGAKRIKGIKPKKLKSEKDSKELTFDFVKNMFKLTEYTFEKDNDKTDAICLGLAFIIMSEDKNGSV